MKQLGCMMVPTPIEESRTKLKELALLRKLPKIIQDLKEKNIGSNFK